MPLKYSHTPESVVLGKKRLKNRYITMFAAIKIVHLGFKINFTFLLLLVENFTRMKKIKIQ